MKFFVVEFNQICLQDLQLPHNLVVNAANGNLNVVVQIPLPEGRAALKPQLSLQYAATPQKSIVGSGWSLAGLPFIAIDTQKGLPKYDGSDTYAFNGGITLVPELKESSSEWQPRIDENDNYWIYYFRSKTETGFVRFEKWVHKTNHRIHWRTMSPENILSVFGATGTVLADPEKPNNIFIWLLEKQYDQLGNVITYEYKNENADEIDTNASFERKRFSKTKESGFAQKYPSKILYGNTVPVLPDQDFPSNNHWLFSVVFDYGEFDDRPYENDQPRVSKKWKVRQDPFSVYKAGFEIRTYRLCKRLLIYHHISELSDKPSMTGILTLNYDESPLATTLKSVFYTGIRRDLLNGNYSEKQLPPVSFDYTKTSLGRNFKITANETTNNLPLGLTPVNTRFIDLLGEGLPGILTESANQWYYKVNKGNGVFDHQHIIINKPSQLKGIYSLGDFDHNGNLDLFSIEGREAGYYEYDRDTMCWSGFKTFKDIPQVPKGKFIDINADGFTDLLIETEDKITCYPFKGKEGFGNPFEFSKQFTDNGNYAPSLGDNLSLDYFMTDMTGDGLPDQVCIRNGRVEYYPNLGNGRFGEAILMANAPVFDFESSFDASRIRLYDLDGSGTTDILYLGRGEIRYWYNATGNCFIEGGTITGLPYIDLLSTATILDFLGNGSPCLVWSSFSAQNNHSVIQYLEITNGIQAGLLLRSDNGMGLHTIIEYGYSGTHYLQAANNNDPWISKIPNHFRVVDKKMIHDTVTGSRMAVSYKYYDGCYNGHERSFTCFGRIEEFDTESIINQNDLMNERYQPVKCTRTWLHSGLFGWDNRQRQQFYQLDIHQPFLTHQFFEQTDLLNDEDFLAAYQSISGKPVRQEIYQINEAGQINAHPFSVSGNKYAMRKIQPAYNKNKACYCSFQAESVTMNYEQVSNDPRIIHQLVINTDECGHITRQVTVAYARRSNGTTLHSQQNKDYIACSVNNYGSINKIDHYQTGIPYENKTFEINHISRQPNGLISWNYVKENISHWIDAAKEFHETLNTNGNTEARLLNWSRVYYWNDSLTDILPFTEHGNVVLSHHEAMAVFTDQLATDVFSSKLTGIDLGIAGAGSFVAENNYWWQHGVITWYNGFDKFYTPDRIGKDTSEFTSYQYDTNYLSVIETTDPLGNTKKTKLDYNIIKPYRTIDANDNIAEVLYDPLGMAVVTSDQGTILNGSSVEKYGNGWIEDYIRRTDESFDSILADPDLFLQQASAFFYYDFEQKPLRCITLTRESLVYDGKGNVNNLPVIQIEIDYQDAFGRTIQSKRKVDEGPAIQKNNNGDIVIDAAGIAVQIHTTDRWWVSGHILYNNKQTPVQQYEPFYSATPAFESDTLLETFGVAVYQYYDVLNRLFRTDFPNGTFSETIYEPWQIKNFDQNDTVGRSMYKLFRETQPAGSVDRRILDQTMPHNDTPVSVLLDPLEREIVNSNINTDRSERITENVYDANGNIGKITDARGLTAFEYKYDMLGHLLYEKSIDAGEKWNLYNADGLLIYNWNSRGTRQFFQYDPLNRMLTAHVLTEEGLNHITERCIYGEDPSIIQAKEKNLREQLVKQYDQAGLQELLLAAPGNLPVKVERKLLNQFIQEPDWTDPTIVPLMNDVFTSVFTYDALARITEQQLPDQTTRKYEFNKGAQINSILLTTEDPQWNNIEIIKQITYNAKGLRESALLGNDILLNYEYDRDTFLLQRLRANGSRNYQDIKYSYDPVGNLIHMSDDAQQPVSASNTILQGLSVSSDSAYEYDAFYQLIKAEGRVHQALLQTDFAVTRTGILKGTRHISLNNAAAIERYTRHYEYDIAGNKKSMSHRGISQNWTDRFQTAAHSNRTLPVATISGTPVLNPDDQFDANGNCLYMPHARSVEWNYRNNISKVVIIDRSADSKPNDEEYYVYDGSGKRIRKITQRVIDLTNETIELTEKIYLDGCEIKRITRSGTELLQRITSKISDGVNQLCLIHSWKSDLHQRETNNISDKKIHYLLKDHLGSTAMEIDANGNAISYEEYFPFGGTSFIAGNNTKDIELKDYRYCGKECDDFTGLYYFGYRYYAHWIGGWMSPDPIGSEDSVNLYLYVHNNPVNLVDPNGLQSSEVHVRMLSTTAALPEQLVSNMAPGGHIYFVEGMTERYDYSFAETVAYVREHGGTIQVYDTSATRRFFTFLEDSSDRNYSAYRDLVRNVEAAWEEEFSANFILEWHQMRSSDVQSIDENDADVHGNGGNNPVSSSGNGNDAGNGGSATGRQNSSGSSTTGNDTKKTNNTTGANGDTDTSGTDKNASPGATTNKNGRYGSGPSGNPPSTDMNPGLPPTAAGDGNRQGAIEGGETGFPNGNINGNTDAASGAGTLQGQRGPGGRGNESATGTGRHTSGGVNPNGSDEEPTWWQGILLAMAGALYSVANIFIEAGKQLYDLVGLSVACLGTATGWYEYEHEAVSGIGLAAEAGQSTTDILLNMGRNILETPSRLLAAAERGDYFEFGAESMNLYMLGRSAYGFARGVPSMIRGVANIARSGSRAVSQFFARATRTGAGGAWRSFMREHAGLGATNGSGIFSMSRGYALRSSPVKYAAWRAAIAIRSTALAAGRILSRLNPRRFTSNQIKGLVGRELARIKSFFRREQLIGRELELHVNGVRTIADLVVMDQHGFIIVIEAKFGPHSGFTPAQLNAWTGGSVSFRVEAFGGSKVKVP